MTDELTKALLLEEVASEDAIAAALFASVTNGIPLVRVLAESAAVGPIMLARYLSRTDTPYLRQVVPLLELVERLPPGLCDRLYALPVRRDAITATVDVVVADADDAHPLREIAFHLGVPVRLVRADVTAIEEALHRLRSRHGPPSGPPDEGVYDSRPPGTGSPGLRGGTLPPADPDLRPWPLRDAMPNEPRRPSRPPGERQQAHVLPGGPHLHRRSSVTPPWGTQVHAAQQRSGEAPSEPPSRLGSEIPIPLTRRTSATVSGGTQRPPPLVDPADSLGEGYAVDAAHFRQIVEVNNVSRNATGSPIPMQPMRPAPSFIPGPPPLPGNADGLAVAEIGGILAALRAAGSRDEVLELVLTGARMVALKVALFVVKRSGYLGWACTPEFGERAALQEVLVPLESPSVFEEAVRHGIYLGPIRHDNVHAVLLGVMRTASRNVAVLPIRVSGKAAVVVIADHLGEAMLATRRLEELARAAGDAFGRIVRMRR